MHTRFCLFLTLACVLQVTICRCQEPKINLLWISVEDIGPHLGCYGDRSAFTPSIDRLAAEGIRYTNAFTTCPVCATNRSSIITGVYPTTLGTMHMRCEAVLPDGVRCFSSLLRDAGYYCSNNSKTDYNFPVPEDAWDKNGVSAHWRGREKGQPFFAVFNFTVTHESQIWPREQVHSERTPEVKEQERQDPNAVTLPPYYPDTPESRRDWANYMENITQVDYLVGGVLEELEEDGLAASTIVFFWSDHGVGLPRGKRFPYDSGLHVPLIVHIPEALRGRFKLQAGSERDELVGFVDLAPTVLSLAGVEAPEHLQGRDFLSGDTAHRRYVFSVRDRMDERYDLIRSVRDRRYRYLRNYMAWKPYTQRISFAEVNQTMQALRRLESSGSLPEDSRAFMAESKPVEELYDTRNDPHELVNLAGSADPEHRAALKRFRAALSDWEEKSGDLGFIPEPILRSREEELGSCSAILENPEYAAALSRVRRLLSLEIAHSEKIQLAFAAVGSADPMERYWGVTALSHPVEHGLELSSADDQRACGAFLQLLSDVNPAVRVAAAEAVGGSEDRDRALGVLVSELEAPSPWVRLLAANAIDRLSPTEPVVLEALERALDDELSYVELVAEWTLHQMIGRPVEERWFKP